MPIGQVYRVGLGNDNPYTVCAGLQDNGAWCGPSNSLDPSGIQNKAWIASAGGDGEWSIPEPDDPNWLWSDSENGSLTVYNRVTQDQWSAQPYLQTGKESWELATSKYRFNWESPIAIRSVAQERRLVRRRCHLSRRPIAEDPGARLVPISRAISKRISSRPAVQLPTTFPAQSTATRFSTSKARRRPAARFGLAPTTGSFSSRATVESIGRT